MGKQFLHFLLYKVNNLCNVNCDMLLCPSESPDNVYQADSCYVLHSSYYQIH